MTRKAPAIIIFILCIGLYGNSSEEIERNHDMNNLKSSNEVNTKMMNVYNHQFTIFVSPHGSDRNIGSEDNPYKTITKFLGVKGTGHVLLFITDVQ